MAIGLNKLMLVRQRGWLRSAVSLWYLKLQMDYDSAEEWLEEPQQKDEAARTPTGFTTKAMHAEHGGEWRTGRAPALEICKAALPVRNLFANLSSDDAQDEGEDAETPHFTFIGPAPSLKRRSHKANGTNNTIWKRVTRKKKRLRLSLKKGLTTVHKLGETCIRGLWQGIGATQLTKLRQHDVADAVMVLDWMGYAGGMTSSEDDLFEGPYHGARWLRLAYGIWERAH